MGVDIGTSGCKAVVFDNNGRQVSLAYREYDVISSTHGHAELDSNEVMRKCFEVIGESASVLPGTVRCLGISSQGEAFTPVDAKGTALTNAMVSSDSRAAGHINTFCSEFGAEKLYRITGHTPHPMFSLFKLLWIRDNRPDVFAKTAKFLCFEDLLQLRLGLEPTIAWPLAGRTMLFDVMKHCWSEEIISAAGLRTDMFASPLPSGAKAGEVEKSIAARLNLASGAFVVAGGHDQPCCALGAGVTAPEVACYAIGTVECITPAFAAPAFSNNLQRNNLCTYDYTVQGMYTTVAFCLTGGNILKWFRDEFGYEENAEAKKTSGDVYSILLGKLPVAPTNLTVLPYFTPSGTPHFDTKTAGAILGLRMSTKREEILKALLEGVTFEMRLNLEILENSGCRVNELRAVGGGAKSVTLMQLKADVFGKPIGITDITEAGCLGTAMLAKASFTGEDIRQIANKWIKIKTLLIPQTDFAARYNEQFELYKQVYPKLRVVS